MPAKNRGLDAERSARRSFEKRIESRLADIQRDVQQLREAIYETDRKVIELEMERPQPAETLGDGLSRVFAPMSQKAAEKANSTPEPTAPQIDRMLNLQLGRTKRWFPDAHPQVIVPAWPPEEMKVRFCPGCGRPEDECDTQPKCRPENQSTV